MQTIQLLIELSYGEAVVNFTKKRIIMDNFSATPKPRNLLKKSK